MLNETGVIDSFEHEELMVRAWLTTLDESEGVSLYSQSSLRVLQIINRDALRKAGIDLHRGYSWREPFIKGFTDFRKHWVTQSVVESLPLNLITEDVDFYLNNEPVVSLVGAELSIVKNET